MPVGPYVYRAVSSKDWVTKSGVPKVPAFRRRWKFKDDGEARRVWDEHGLSFGLSPEDACRGLIENFGILKLSVAKMRVRQFEFDEEAEGHVNVINMPFYRPEDRDLANAKASSMLECVEEFIPPQTYTEIR